MSVEDDEEWASRFYSNFLLGAEGRKNRDRILASVEGYFESLRHEFVDGERAVPGEVIDQWINQIRFERLRNQGIDIGLLIRFATRGHLDLFPFIAGSFSLGSIMGLVIAVLTRTDPLVPVVVAITLAVALSIFSFLVMAVTWRIRRRFRI